MLIVAYVPIQVSFKLLIQEEYCQPLCLILVMREILVFLMFLNIMWIAEHFIEEEGGKFEY